MKYATRRDYIKSLKLAIDGSFKGQADGLPTPDADADNAYVVGGSIIGCEQQLSAQRNQDVLNSTLFAQLAANYVADKEEETEAWYAQYTEVLENIGWVISSFAFQTYEASGTSVRLDRVALALLAAAAGGSGLTLLTAAISALSAEGDGSSASQIFEQNGAKSGSGNFQLGAASLNPNGNVQMPVGAFKFTADQQHNRFLFIEWNTESINIYQATQNIILNEQIYGTVRDDIVAELGGSAKQYVAKIKIRK